MPQLPSGRHIALNAEPLDKLIARCDEVVTPVEFLAIETKTNLFQYIQVLYFKEVKEASTHKLAKGSLDIPLDIEPYDSGFNLCTIESEFRQWSQEDQNSFKDFVSTERFENYINRMFQIVIDTKDDIKKYGDFLQKATTYWWELGIHPVQPND